MKMRVSGTWLFLDPTINVFLFDILMVETNPSVYNPRVLYFLRKVQRHTEIKIFPVACIGTHLDLSLHSNVNCAKLDKVFNQEQ